MVDRNGSRLVERGIRLGCLAFLIVGMAFFAGLAVWALITHGHLSTSGWICTICFLVLIPAAIRIFRRGRPGPGKDGPPN